LLWDESGDELVFVGNGTKLSFYDAAGGENISADASGVLSIAGGSEIDLTATAIDINGTADVSGTLTVGGVLTVNNGAVFNEASADVDFRVESNGNINMLFVDAGNDRIGIGTATPDNPLEVVGGFKCGSTSATSGFNDHAIILCDSGTAYEGGLLITQQDSAAADKSAAKFNVTSSAASGTADMTIGVVDNEAPNTYIRRWFYCDGATGNVNIGTDDTPTSKLVVRNDADFLTATVNVLHIMDNHATVDTADVLARFDFSADADVDGARALSFHDSGGEIGSITLDGNATAFNTSSDYRLKTDLKDIVDAIGTINKLKLYDFAWKKNTSKRLTGIIAHEAAEIVPYAIRGEKDAMTVDDDGESIIDAQGADYSKFVPLLLKSIQELSASNDALKARIEVLEAA
jgi:hypothetical protein